LTNPWGAIQNPLGVGRGRGSVPMTTTNTSSINESAVATLMRLGFSREQCIQALTLYSGNTEMAASYLYGGMFD